MKKTQWNQGWAVSQSGEFFGGFHGGGNAPAVNLPHDALISGTRSPDSPNGPDAAWYDGGTYIYTKSLTPDPAWARKPLWLELEGAAENTMVYVNGQFAGKCPYAYSGFRVNVGALLVWGQPNEIKIVTKTGMQQTSRWYSGGGIFRPLWLLTGDCVQVEPEGVGVTTLMADTHSATVQVSVKVGHQELGSRKIRVELTLLAPDGTAAAADSIPVTLMDMETVTVNSRMELSRPLLWNVDSPSLYTAAVRLTEGEHCFEEQRVPFGVRTLTVDRTHGLRINGETVKLRGACIHHDNGILGAVTLKDAELRRVKRLKDAGFNAIRSAHNPASRALLDACDEVGMLVMDELFDVWNTSKRDHDYSLSFAEWWRRDMQSIVEKDYNHPSVILYTVGNEIPETGTPGGAALNRKMVEQLHQLDATRPVVNCINGMFSVMPRMGEILQDVLGGETEIPADINEMMTLFDANIDQIMCHQVVTDATEETFAGVDVCGYNYMASRYVPDGSRYPNRVILGSETNPDKIGHNWPLVQSLDYVLGDFCWTGWDYIGEAGVGKNDYDMTHAMYGPWPWFLAYCGDFDLCGNRRPQSYYREIVFGRRTQPYLCVERPEHHHQPKCTTNWTWSDVVESWTWPGFEGRQTRVEIYSAGDEVELLCNGRSLGRAKVGETMPCRAEFDDVTYEPGTLTAVAYAEGQEIGRMELHTAGEAVCIAIQPECTATSGDIMSLVYLNLSLTDGEGRLNPSAQAEITLQVEGPAQLAGFGSADPKSLESFCTHTHALFDGRGLAVLRAQGQAGQVTVTATAEGFRPATVEITLA